MEGAVFYLFLAYSILWAINFGYLFFIDKRIKDVHKEIEHLEKVVGGD